MGRCYSLIAQIMSRWDEGTLEVALAVAALVVAVVVGIGVAIFEGPWKGILGSFAIAALWGGFELFLLWEEDRD